MAGVVDGGRAELTMMGSGDLFFDGMRIATNGEHRFVVDAAGMVWDPIVNVWGTMTEAEYLAHLSTTR